ncbi:putative proteasome regulatory complex protein [Ordospora colligata]|uniref:Putative proteasome regulatory complex protein n=1 Tax=Ordospora colligata OC4 TaxID=1354746 RepID=A0A0B2UMH5_9MICR|nr:putative proteasome regulatory complex protein [Ordospora colligata OC4]KHN70489.1 putative proteasome regulatory complex protein [Ordospora colligata OC4]TBU17239.1 putative proteasome regulatory complex protein [Ordospora colligata]TBU17489.1 putative proteasome regulatory complex protein [Ordospora colligata]TBU19669.1 putative proteasome regulatory complex protein [Ordospora colligata]
MEALLEDERKCRIANDYEGLQKIFEKMMELCTTDEELASVVRMLSMKRGQNKMAMKWMIGELFNKKKNEEGFIRFFSLILKDVIEGKIFMEEERIYITEDLKRRYEAGNDVENAFDVVINVPVETFTMLKEFVVINYQLEQLRLCILNMDWIRADITMKKIRKKYFDTNVETVGEKVKFYELSVLLHLGQRKYFDASCIYYALSELGVNVCKYVVLSSFFSILTTCDSGLEDFVSKKKEMLTKLAEDKNNSEASRKMVGMFLADMVIDKSVINEIRDVFCEATNTSKYLNEIVSCIDEHNFRVIAKFHSSISIQDMAMIMQTPEDDVINRISFMVNNNFVNAKIDQKTGMVDFGTRKWSDNVGNVLDKLIRCNHLIHKERLQASIKED